MTRKRDLAATPTETAFRPVEEVHDSGKASVTIIDTERLDRLLIALEALATQAGDDPELRLYTPAQAGEILGKSENWVVEAIQDGKVPFTRVGQSPRMKAAHIRQVIADGEVLPHKYSSAA